ncbi:MAG: dual specificity protein phosphatase family protein [Acidiferrobacterales bacterium]
MTIDYDPILDDVLVGTYPRDGDDVAYLRNAHAISAVLNLQTDDDMQYWGLDWLHVASHYRQNRIEVARVPIRDFDPVDLREKLEDAVHALDTLLQHGHRVYVHCTAGVGRSPATVIAWLAWRRGWDLGDAVRHVMKQRVCAPFVDAIRLAEEDRRAAPG